RRCAKRSARCELEVPVARRFCSPGGETSTGGSCDAPDDCAWIFPGVAESPSATQLAESNAAFMKRSAESRFAFLLIIAHPRAPQRTHAIDMRGELSDATTIERKNFGQCDASNTPAQSNQFKEILKQQFETVL